MVGVKAAYVRGVLKSVYGHLHGLHSSLFEETSHFPQEVFNHLFAIVEGFISRTMDMRLVSEGESKAKPGKRIVSGVGLFFLYLYILGGCTRGRRAFEKVPIRMVPVRP